jgi:hypothetical protein
LGNLRWHTLDHLAAPGLKYEPFVRNHMRRHHVTPGTDRTKNESITLSDLQQILSLN